MPAGEHGRPRVANGRGGGQDQQGILGVTQLLVASPDALVAVQTIGDVGPEGDVVLRDDWSQLGTRLARFGANPDTFNTVNGSYAFVGAPQLQRNEVAQSSSAAGAGSTNELPEPGTLQGVLRIRSDGYFMPLVSDPSRPLDDSLYDIALRPGSPWPYSEAAGTPDLISGR